jgi:hypothetical protein
MKIFIADVPYKLEEGEFKTMLTQFGKVESIKLITDEETGKRKGLDLLTCQLRTGHSGDYRFKWKRNTWKKNCFV